MHIYPVISDCVPVILIWIFQNGDHGIAKVKANNILHIDTFTWNKQMVFLIRTHVLFE